MTKDEILQKSRSDNGGRDVEDLEVQKAAARVAYFSAFGFCLLISLIDWIFTRRVGLQCWIVLLGMLSTTFFVKFAMLRKRHELLVALGYTLLFAALLLAYILYLTGRLALPAGA